MSHQTNNNNLEHIRVLSSSLEANQRGTHTSLKANPTISAFPQTSPPEEQLIWRILLGCSDSNFLPTNGCSIKPLKVKLLAGELKATKTRSPSKEDPHKKKKTPTTTPRACLESKGLGHLVAGTLAVVSGHYLEEHATGPEMKQILWLPFSSRCSKTGGRNLQLHDSPRPPPPPPPPGKKRKKKKRPGGPRSKRRFLSRKDRNLERWMVSGSSPSPTV